MEHGGRGYHRKVLAVAKKLIAVLEREPPSADRDLMLVNALAVRADVLGRQRGTLLRQETRTNGVA